MNKKEFIEILIDMGGCGAKPETWARGWDDAIGEVIEIAEELDESEQTDNNVGLLKPVIPRFVADYIEKWKHEDLAMRTWFTFDYDDEDEHKVSKWLYDNNYEEQITREHLLIDAIRYGYEVEKEKQWVVKIGKGYFSGYDETRVTYVLDNFPGEIARKIVYDDLNEAESDANDIGGEVEEVTE